MSSPNQPTVTTDQARQSVGFLNQFLERLRQQKDVNVLNMFSFAELANLHISMLRLNTHFTEQPEPVQEAVPVVQEAVVAQPVSVQAPPQLHTI